MKLYLAGSILAFSAVAFLSGCGTQSAGGAQELRNSLSSAAQSGKFYYAHQDDLVYGHTWKVEDAMGDDLSRSDVKTVCGSKPAIVGFDLGGIELDAKANLDGVDFFLMRRAAVSHSEQGGMVTFSWHMRNPLTGGDSWDISSDKVVSSVLKGGENHEKFISWLGKAADFLASLKDAKGQVIPVIFRPWHENIGSWFWWGGNLCTAEQYKALFALTYDYMTRERGLKNLLWVYSPNSEIDSTQYFSRYPGDAYVDILGVDHYEFVSADLKGEEALSEADAHYMEVLRRDLSYMQEFAEKRGKLIAVSETGFEGTPNPRWWTDVLLKGVSSYPVCYVLTWRNAWDKPGHFYAPFEGSADAQNFREFYSSDKTLFLADIK